MPLAPLDWVLIFLIRQLKLPSSDAQSVWCGLWYYANANNDEDSEFALSRLRKALEKAGIGPIEFEYEPVAAAYFYASTLDHAA